MSKFENKLLSSPQILLQLVAAFEAVRPLVAQPDEKSFFNQCFLMTERAKETREVRPLVAQPREKKVANKYGKKQPREPEDLQKLLRLVQLAGEVTLQKKKGLL